MYHLPTPTIYEAHLREMVLYRDLDQLEQDTTVGNIVNTYMRNPFDAEDGHDFVDVDLSDTPRPSSAEIFRGVAGPPMAPLPDLPPAATSMSAAQRFTHDQTELPSSEQTYGNTGQLLNLDVPSSEQRHFLGLGERMFYGGHISTSPYDSDDYIPRSRMQRMESETDWESMQSDMDDLVRISQDSYADTSAPNSQHRLSYPRRTGSQATRRPDPQPAMPRTPTNQTDRAMDFAGPSSYPHPDEDQRTPVLPPWRDVAEAGDTTLAGKILEDKLLQDGILGHMGHSGPRQNAETKKDDMKALEELRKKNPSALRAAVDMAMEKVSNIPSSLNAIFGAHSAQDMGRQTLLDNAEMDGMHFSPTLNSFRTSTPTPDGSAMGTPRAPVG